MKKLVAMMMVMAMAFSAAACGGGEEAPAVSALVEKQFGEYVSMMIPDDCDDMVEQAGMAGVPGPDYSVVVADPYEADLVAADVTEDIVMEMFAGDYANAELLNFQNPIEIDGTEAVRFTVAGTDENGTESTQTFVILYYLLDDVLNEQIICYTYNTGADSSLEVNLDEIIGSIKIG